MAEKCPHCAGFGQVMTTIPCEACRPVRHKKAMNVVEAAMALSAEVQACSNIDHADLDRINHFCNEAKEHALVRYRTIHAVRPSHAREEPDTHLVEEPPKYAVWNPHVEGPEGLPECVLGAAKMLRTDTGDFLAGASHLMPEDIAELAAWHRDNMPGYTVWMPDVHDTYGIDPEGLVWIGIEDHEKPNYHRDESEDLADARVAEIIPGRQERAKKRAGP